MNDWPKKVASWMINELLRYWKKPWREEDCLITPEEFSTIVWGVEYGNILTRAQGKQLLKEIWAQRKPRDTFNQENRICR